jgi:site-specific recombinase XerD
MRSIGAVPGAASLHLVDGVSLLRPEDQVFSAMLAGFANQQLARNLARSTVEGRENTVRAFVSYVNAFPWQWSPAMVDEWLGDLRSLRDLKRSTIRAYSEAVRAFCHFATDPAYEWAATCEKRFGTHPVQVVHEWNTAAHVQDNEADPKKRAFTREELHAFFAHCDDQVARIRAFGRKGWLPAFRDATLFKTAYAFGLRRNETRMLDAVDFGRNVHAAEFGAYGVCRVRFGKAKKGSPPKQRSVLTVWAPGHRRCSRSGSARSGRCSAPRATRQRGPPSAGRGWAVSGWTPGSSPIGRRSVWTLGWIFIRCAVPTSRT